MKITFKYFHYCLFFFTPILSAQNSTPAINQEPAPLSIVWEGSFLDLGSLSLVNQSFSKQLMQVPGVKLTCVSNRNLSSLQSLADPKVIDELKNWAHIVKIESTQEAQITVRHSWPPNWQAPKKGKWVLMQPWEYGYIPLEWVENIKKVDEVWVPTYFVKREFVESGVPESKVVVIPNGVDCLTFNPQIEPFPLKTNKKFKFLFLGGTIYRKGPDLLLTSYLKTFTNFDDVCLVVKDVGVKEAYAGQTYEKMFKEFQNNPNAPEIIYLDENLTANQIASIYKACDCLVHPYRGEGFGLPVLEAMACGLPVLVTKGGATDDFVTNAYGWLIPSLKKSIGLHFSGYTLAGEGWLMEPDIEALSMQMRWIANHPFIAKSKGAAASQYVKEHWTWQKAAEQALNRLKLIAN
ncbi:glycosyltransferase family 4 protein [Candidatus Protochlamydia amoebophila]|uniref:Putative mannosyltransferase n=1 Tax=Candidatus Protochlamydia amoebophila TaxID=362787 RepID=A0A0C1JVX5_9BACT|nr:glycosyltransferase family 4 protein [Candidatus Protochlamydia amoebophila]KIC71402.1 putative mannosyltransferase [Candidatus Protochlamydia amoebophila]